MPGENCALSSSTHRYEQQDVNDRAQYFARRCVATQVENRSLRGEIRRLQQHSQTLIRLLDARSSQVQRLVTSVCEMIDLYRKLRAAVALNDAPALGTHSYITDGESNEPGSSSFSTRTTASIIDQEDHADFEEAPPQR